MMLTLAVLAGLVALVGVLASGNGTSMQAQTNRMALRRARFMAESGIQRAIAELQLQSKGPVTLNDSWATLGSGGATALVVGSDSFRVQILDTASRINLNTADHDTLAKLPMTSDQVDCLLDWREKTPAARPAGAKDQYYNGLTKPYNTKLQPLNSVDELLQIRNFTPSSLYSGGNQALTGLVTVDSASADLDQNANTKLNIQSATIAQLAAIGVGPQLANTLVQTEGSLSKWADVLGVQGMDQASAKAILNNCQIGANKQTPGLININTATSATLSAVPGIDPDIASSIVDRQSSGFKGIGDLVDVPGLSLAALSKVVDKFAVSSLAFEVRSLGSAAGMDVGLDAIVTTTGDGNFTVARVQPAPTKDPANLWGWPETATDRTTLVGVW
jgi:DNA uptake protein ComE-like DNA-binding protein